MVDGSTRHEIFHGTFQCPLDRGSIELPQNGSNLGFMSASFKVLMDVANYRPLFSAFYRPVCHFH